MTIKKMISMAVSALMCISIIPLSVSADYASDIKTSGKDVAYDGSAYTTTLDTSAATLANISIEKKEISKSEAQSLQTVNISISGAENKYSRLGLHILYDTRLKLCTNDDGEIATYNGSMEHFSRDLGNGEVFIANYSTTNSGTVGEDVWQITFQLPSDAREGDLYPIGIEYRQEQGIKYEFPVTSDSFTNDENDNQGQLMEAYLFTKGISNGYIHIDYPKPVIIYQNTSTATTTTRITTNEHLESITNLGDVDENGIINAVDASRILVLYANINSGKVEVTEQDMAVCDINSDRRLNAVDASLVLAYYADLSAGYNGTLRDYLGYLEEKATATTITTTTTTNTSTNILPDNSDIVFDFGSYEVRAGDVVTVDVKLKSGSVAVASMYVQYKVSSPLLITTYGKKSEAYGNVAIESNSSTNQQSFISLNGSEPVVGTTGSSVFKFVVTIPDNCPDGTYSIDFDNCKIYQSNNKPNMWGYSTIPATIKVTGGSSATTTTKPKTTTTTTTTTVVSSIETTNYSTSAYSVPEMPTTTSLNLNVNHKNFQAISNLQLKINSEMSSVKGYFNDIEDETINIADLNRTYLSHVKSLNNAYVKLKNAYEKKVRYYDGARGWSYAPDKSAIAEAESDIEFYEGLVESYKGFLLSAENRRTYYIEQIGTLKYNIETYQKQIQALL